MKVLGLGFAAAGDGKHVSPESMFMVAELCRGGSLRDVVRDQMMSFSKVSCTWSCGTMHHDAQSSRARPRTQHPGHESLSMGEVCHCSDTWQ